MVKLKFKKTHSTGSDETAPYDVILDRECTVREFIDAVLLRNEWGKIEIRNSFRCVKFNSGMKVPITPCIEYCKNDVTSTNMTDDDMACVINKIRASGGWSNMNYYLEIKKQ